MYYMPVTENTIDDSGIERRRFLQGAMALAAGPPLCCRTPELPRGSVQITREEIVVDLTMAPELRRRGTAFAAIDEGRKINIILIHVERGKYAAMDRSCTHNGAQCTYNPKRRTVQCTSLNHAEFDLRGTLLHGRTHGNLRTYETTTAGSKVVIRLGSEA